MVFSAGVEKSILKLIWNLNGTQILTTILKKNKAGGFTHPYFRTYYKALVFKTVWYWNKDRHMGQSNRIESQEINPHTYGQMILKGCQGHSMGTRQSFLTNSVGKLCPCAKEKGGPLPHQLQRAKCKS